MIGIVLVGAGGRMGRFVQELLADSSDFRISTLVGREDDLPRALADAQAEVGFDLTVAGRGALHARLILEAGLRPLIGTSGVTPDEVAALDTLARERSLGGLVVPNFSLAMAALQRACVQLADVFPRCEIVELHHDTKRDAPSATARETARQIAERGVPEPPIHALRLPGLYAHQEVHFGAPGETLTLRHDMLGPEAFGPGIVAALHHVVAAEGVFSGLRHAL